MVSWTRKTHASLRIEQRLRISRPEVSKGGIFSALTSILNTYSLSHFPTKQTRPVFHCSTLSPSLICLSTVLAADSMVLKLPTPIGPDSHISRKTSTPTHKVHKLLHIYLSQSLEIRLCREKLNGTARTRSSQGRGAGGLDARTQCGRGRGCGCADTLC